MTTQDKDVVKVDDKVVTKTAAADDAPKAEKVSVGGKEFEVPADLAAAIKAARSEAESKTTEGAAREAELRRQLEAATKKPATGDDKGDKDPNDELADLIFTDPKAALKALESRIMAAVEGKTAMKSAQAAFWQQFYEKNPELKGAELVVEGVMGKNMGVLNPLPVEKASERLAELAHETLLKLGVNKKQSKKGKQAEGGTESTGGRSKDTDDVSEDSRSQQSGGISATLKARQQARRDAARGATSS